MSVATRAGLVNAVKVLVTAQVAFDKRACVSTEVDLDLAASALDEALADFERGILESVEGQRL